MVWASSVVASAEPVRRMLRGRCAPQRGVAAPAAGCAALLRAPGSCTPAAVAAAGAAQHRALLPLTGAATAKSALQTRGGGSASGPGAPSDQAAVSRGRRSAATQPCGAHGGASASVDAMASPHWGTHAGAGNDAAANMSGMQPGLAGAGSLSPSWWDGAMSLPSWAMGLARALVSAPAQIEREAASPGAAPPAAQRAQLHGTASVPEAAEEAPKVLPQRHPQQQLHKQQQMPQPQPHHHHQQQQQPHPPEPLMAPFMRRVHGREVEATARMSDLCNMAYEADAVTDVSLAALGHGHLMLVSTSAMPMFGPYTQEQAAAAAAEAAKRAKGGGGGKSAGNAPAPAAQAPVALHLEAGDGASNAAPSRGLAGVGGGDGVRLVLPDDPSATTPDALLSLADHSADVNAEQLFYQCLPGATGRGSLAVVPPPPRSPSYLGSPDVEYSLLMTTMEELLGTIDMLDSQEDMDGEQDSAVWYGHGRPQPATGGSASHRNQILDNIATYGTLDEAELSPGWLPPSPQLAASAVASAAAKLAACEVHRTGTQAGTDDDRASAGKVVAAAAVAAGGAAGEVARLRGHDSSGGEATSAQVANLIMQPDPPTRWFVVDDPVEEVRYFILQGSTNLQHWAINLAFEPVVFEDASLGVRVHRGVYEAALQLYDDLAPLVRQHAATSPYATVALAGHSLGGSLAAVLTLLLVHRGTVRPSRVASCTAFGAPAVFCAGLPSAAATPAAAPMCGDDDVGAPRGAAAVAANVHTQPTLSVLATEDEVDMAELEAALAGSSSPLAAACGVLCGDECQARTAEEALVASTRAGAAAAAARARRAACAKRLPLLQRLGLPQARMLNVMMHKDIVPRAFVCDYTSVAGLLKRWMPSFNDHSSLTGGRGGHKHLYNFLGDVAVLRPDDGAEFVVGDNRHAMLPDVPGLYRLEEPAHGDVQMPPPPVQQQQQKQQQQQEEKKEQQQPLQQQEGRQQEQDSQQPTGAVNLHDALLQFMNHPHPLQSLSAYESYGPNGAVSRFHNPNNYTIGLRRVAKLSAAARKAARAGATDGSWSSDDGDAPQPPPRAHGRVGAR